MDHWNKAADELLTFISSPDLKVDYFVDRAMNNAILQGFDFDTFLAEGPGSVDQAAGLYSEDPTLFDIPQQPVYTEIMSGDAIAKSTLICDSYTNTPSNQTATLVYSELTQQPSASANEATSPFRPLIQQESFVDPASISLSSLPSANYGLDLSDPEDKGSYPYEQELQEEFDPENQRSPEQARLEQQKFRQKRFEKARKRQARPNYTDVSAAHRDAQTQAIREADQPFPEIPLIPAVFLEQFTREINQSIKHENDKISKRLAIAKNKRSANIADLDPAQHYLPLPQTPQSWGGIRRHTGQPIFQYNKSGELDAGKFSTKEINEYLSTHPLHSDATVNLNPPAAKTSGLILWLQICPADSNKRYGDINASKCRFENCAVPKNTIQKGEYRVAFDEQWCREGNNDPFHNAGYVHLFCLEKCFDFPGICRLMNVKADTRELPNEPDKKNKMAITRDSHSMEKVCNDYFKTCVSWETPRSSDYYRHTLCYALTIEHLDRQSSTRKSKRRERGGNNVDVHLNNLDVLAENLARRKQGRPFMVYERSTATAKRHQRRKRKHWDEEEEASSPELPSKKPRGTKQPPQIAAKCKSPTRRPRRPQTLRLASRIVEEESSKHKLPIKGPELLEQKSQDSYYDSTDKFVSPVKSPSLKRDSENDLAPSRQTPKAPKKHQQIFQQEEEYDADVSSSSTPPVGKYCVPKPESPGLKEEVRRSNPVVKRPQTKKRKYREAEDGERSPTEIFRQLADEPLKRYGMNKKVKKGEKAGLSIPLSDMRNLP